MHVEEHKFVLILELLILSQERELLFLYDFVVDYDDTRMTYNI